ALPGDLGRKLAQGLELRVGDRAAFTDGGDRLRLYLRHARQIGVTGHAISALVLVDDGEIDDVALLRGETRPFGDPPKGAVSLERRRALCEDAVQVGHEAPGLLNAVQDFGGSRRRGFRVVKRKSVDHFSLPSRGRNVGPHPHPLPDAAAGTIRRYHSFRRGMGPCANDRRPWSRECSRDFLPSAPRLSLRGVWLR